jgi:hypothetical protein
VIYLKMSDDNFDSISAVTIQPYSDKNVIVQGDYETYSRQMKRFNARWNPRLKAGPGWLVPLEFESAVRAYFGVEEDVRDSQRFKPAQKKQPKKVDAKLPISAEEDTFPDESGNAKDPLPLVKVFTAPFTSNAGPLTKSNRFPAPSVRAPAPSVRAPAPSVADVADDDDDIVSLARKMKDMMARIERLEFNR